MCALLKYCALHIVNMCNGQQIDGNNSNSNSKDQNYYIYMRTRKFNFVGKCSFKFFFIYLFICCLLFLVYFRQSQQEHPITLQLWLFWFCLSLFCIFVFCLLFAVIRFTFYILYIMPIFHFSFFNACCSSHVQWVSWSRRNRDAQSKSSESNMKEDLCFSLLFPPINTYCAHISFFFSFFVHLRLTLRWFFKFCFCLIIFCFSFVCDAVKM